MTLDGWAALDPGARAALTEQWRGVAAGGLPCGAAVTDDAGAVVASGRNRAFDPPTATDPLEGTPVAHAELNALARVATGAPLTTYTLWSSQHPCPMCAAAAAFVGVGRVSFLADDPSEHRDAAAIEASRQGVPYVRAAPPLWAAVANVLFLYTGEGNANLATRRVAWPALTALVDDLLVDDVLGRAARAGRGLVETLDASALRLADAAAQLG